MKRSDDMERAWDEPFAEPDFVETDHHELIDRETHGEETEGTSSADPFGLYLHQMGSIPMLKRKDELELTKRLDWLKTRYRRAALSSAFVLARVAETFERIRAGQGALDRTIDEVPSAGLTSAHVRLRLTRYLRKLRELLAEAEKEFSRLQRPRSRAEALRRRRRHRLLLRRARKIAQAMSPRTELLDAWTAELERQTAQLAGLARQPKARQALALQLQATPKEAARLVHSIQVRRTRYLEARSRLAEANLRLVVSIAKKYRGQGLPFADLIQEGNSGLMRAVDKFDYRLGWKFGTYATWWVRQGVTRALADSARTVRVPSHQISVLRAIERVRGEMTVQGSEPTLEAIAKKLGITIEDARVLHTAGHHTASLDVAPHGDDESGTLRELVHTQPAPDLGRELDRKILRERLDESLRWLPPRYREVIELRYGLRDGRAWSLEEVAQAFGITRERVRQIQAAALDKLRQPERSAGLAHFGERQSRN
jgi:RNA polymerase primary sigma factor